MNLKEYRTHFDKHFSTRLDTKLDWVRWHFPDDETFELLTYLKPYVDHGKRFRPYMVYLRYSLYGWEDLEYITQVGFISEMIHIFALIHDDICDQGTMRHGIPTYHLKLAKKYDNPYTWDVQAMLVWDLVYTWALQEAQVLISGTPAHPIIFDLLNEVVIWEMLDVHYSSSSDQMRSQDTIATKDHLKSGQYSFQKPMMIWASLAGSEDLDPVTRLGHKIGVAFQMRDDLLDWVPNSEWKTKMSDIQEWNQTAVMLACRESFSPADFQTLRESRGQKLWPEQLSKLQGLFEQYNIKNTVSDRISSLLDEVADDFAALDLRSSHARYFQEIITMLRSI